MFGVCKGWIGRGISRWLNRERPPADSLLCDFDRLSYEIRPADIVLVEGRTRVGDVIKVITQSRWSHAAIYIGRLYDIDNPDLREQVLRHYQGDPNDQLVVEALLGEGTVVRPLSSYTEDNLRMCRPKGLSRADAQGVIEYVIERLGTEYDLRQILDLARFLLPYGLLPRRWRSSLFEHSCGNQTRTVCSTMIAEAFGSVRFPVLPFLQRGAGVDTKLIKRNPKLFTPSDFDYSPYFEIIKYPMFGVDDIGLYRQLPWGADDVVCNDALADCDRIDTGLAAPSPTPFPPKAGNEEAES